MEPARNLNYDPHDEKPVTRPNLRALEGGGENAEPRSRGHLQSVPNTTDDTSLQGIKSAEEGGNTKPQRHLSSVPATGGLYTGGDAEADPKTNFFKSVKNKLSTISRRKKAFVSAGAGSLAALVFATSSIMPLYRIPSIMNGITEETGSTLQEVVEKHFERMAIVYLIEKAGGTPNGNAVVTGSFLSDVYASFRLYGLEERVYKNTGFRLEKQNGIVRLTHDGRTVSDKPIKNYDDLIALSQQDSLTSKELKRALRGLSKSFPAWRVILTYHYKKWGSIQYKVKNKPPKYDKSKSPNENVGGLKGQQIDTVSSVTVGRLSAATDCLLGNCDAFDADIKPDPNVAEDIAEMAEHDKTTGATEAINSSVQEAAAEAKEEVVANPASQASWAQRMTEKIASKLFGKVAGKALASAIPFVGWFDFFATIQHMAGTYYSKGYKEKVPTMLREAAYGAIFTAWSGYADAIKAGLMHTTFVGVLTKQLSGSETAQAYKFVYDKTLDKGKKIITPVNNDGEDQLHEMIDFVYGRLALPARLPFEIWYFTIGKLIGWVGDVAFQGIAWLFTVTGLTAAMGSGMEKVFGENWQEELAKWTMESIMSILAIDIDPLAVGDKLFNSIFAGGDVAMNAYCKSIGCEALTEVGEREAYQRIEAEEAAYIASLPLKDRLFSLDVSTSLASTFMRTAPMDLKPQTLVASAMASIQSIPGALLATVTGNAYAAATPLQRSSIAGVRQYGATEASLSQGIAPELLRPGEPECPEVDEDEYNNCTIGLTVGQSIICFADPSKTCPGLTDNSNNNGQSVPGAITKGNPRELAEKVLKNNRIILRNNWARQDVVSTMEGAKIAACNAEPLNPYLLQLLLDIVDPTKGKFDSVEVGYFVTQHECDGKMHPQSQAMDIKAINGKAGRADGQVGADNALSQRFAEFVAGELSLTGGGGIGQQQCAAFTPIEWPDKVTVFDDTCDHIHIDVRGLP